MKNIYVKKNIIGGAPAWYSNKHHKFSDGDYIKIMSGNEVLGRYIVRHSHDAWRCTTCPLNDFHGTGICVLKRDVYGGMVSLCADVDLAKEEGKLITFIDIMNVMEEL